MVNIYLFKSAIGFGAIHYIALIYYRNTPFPVRSGILVSVVTSIWNHGVTSPIAKWCDRAVMSLAAIQNMYVILFIIQPNNGVDGYALFVFLISSIFLYALAKKREEYQQHLVAHALITITNLGILSRLDLLVDTEGKILNAAVS